MTNQPLKSTASFSCFNRHQNMFLSCTTDLHFMDVCVFKRFNSF